VEYIHLFIGPYAQWRVRVADWYQFPRSEARQALEAEVLDDVSLDWNFGQDWPLDGDRADGMFSICGMPGEVRPGAPDRLLKLVWDLRDVFCQGWPSWPAASDWVGLDRQAEVEWFRGAYRAELERAALLHGGPPNFRWGLVLWYE
jgi:hypothetical protein